MPFGGTGVANVFAALSLCLHPVLFLAIIALDWVYLVPVTDVCALLLIWRKWLKQQLH